MFPIIVRHITLPGISTSGHSVPHFGQKPILDSIDRIKVMRMHWVASGCFIVIVSTEKGTVWKYHRVVCALWTHRFFVFYWIIDVLIPQFRRTIFGARADEIIQQWKFKKWPTIRCRRFHHNPQIVSSICPRPFGSSLSPSCLQTFRFFSLHKFY